MAGMVAVAAAQEPGIALRLVEAETAERMAAAEAAGSTETAATAANMAAAAERDITGRRREAAERMAARAG